MAGGAIDPNDDTTATAPPGDSQVVPGGNIGKMPASASVPPTTIPGIGAPAGAGAPGAPGAGQPNTIDNTQKGQIPTVDTSNIKYDPDKLKKAQTTLDVLDAMQPKSRNEYMDAWEKQYGAINDHFDNLQKQLGTRPSDDGMSKKEKFAALLEFGLHMMQATAKPQQSQGAAIEGATADSIHATQAAHQANVAGQQNDYDAKQQAINQGRAGELKTLGTLPNAVEHQAGIDEKQASTFQHDAAGAKDLMGGNPLIVVDAKGKQWEKQPGDPAWKPSVGVDGTPIQRPIGTGSRGGAAHTSVYEESLLEYDKRNPISPNASSYEKQTHDMAALAYAKGKSTIDASLYGQARNLALRAVGTRSNYPGSSDEYDAELRNQTADTYDRLAGGSPSNMGGPKTPANVTPAQPGPVKPPGGAALMGLKPGYQRQLSDGSVWTVGIDGQPHNLRPPNTHASPLTLQ